MNSNLTEEEREHVMGLFPRSLTVEERDMITAAMRRYIFFESAGRNRRIYTCPVCGEYEARRHAEEDIYITHWLGDSFRYHHRDEFTCPICGFRGTLISVAKAKSRDKLWEQEKILILREADGWVLAEAYHAIMDYSYELRPEADMERAARYAFREGKRQKWTWDFEWERDELCYWVRSARGTWTARKGVTEPFSAKTWYGTVTDDGSYLVIGLGAEKRTELRYCQLEQMITRMGEQRWSDELGECYIVRGVINWLAQSSAKPALEMLLKCGHTGIAEAVWKGEGVGNAISWKAKTPWAAWRMTKKEYKAAMAAKLSDEEIIWRRNNAADIPMETFARWKGVLGDYCRDFCNRMGRHRSADRIVTWLNRYTLDGNTPSMNSLYRLWTDMLDLERECGNDITHENVLMPENIQERHDELVNYKNANLERLKSMSREKANIYYRKGRMKELRERYEYSDGELLIRVPETGEEIEAEGAMLRHCVAGYADRHLQGIKTVLFLRWADDPDTPYITVEVAGDGHIVQIHGYRNEGSGKTMSPREIHGEFLDEWLAWIRAGSRRDKQGNPIRNKEEAA